MFLLHIARFATLALLQSAPAQAPSSWQELDLPVGFSLDLTSGAVVSRPVSESNTIVYADGLLRAIPRLGRWERSTAERVSARVVRGAGVPVNQPVAVSGDEFLFDLDDGSWGYLRVLRVGSESVRFELARADLQSEVLARDPREISVSSGRNEIGLFWASAAPDSEYEVWRAVLESGAPPELLGRVTGSQFIDEDAPPGQPVEYRVQRVGDGPAFGASVRALTTDNPPEWPIPIERGLFIDLLSGEIGGPNAHVEVAYASDTHLNLRPTEGVLMARMTRSGTSSAWTLPDPAAGSYQGKLFSAQVGEDLAVEFPGPIYARLRFSSAGEGRGVSLRRQLDLDGTRLLPLPPVGVEATWAASGPVLVLDALAVDVPLRDSVMVVVERELDYASDNWEEFKLAAPGARSVRLQLSDRIRATGHIGRFRLRHAYPWGARSLPGEPIRVAFGDLSDADTLGRLLDAGLRDLVDDSYVRRVAARGLLEEIGPEAWPRLREALESEDPELAGAARDILLTADATRGDHVAFVLMAQAEADGIGELPPGWLDPDVDRRALAVLRTWGQARGRLAPRGDVELDQDRLAGWLRVLIRAEPDEGLRRLAMLLMEQMQLVPAPPAFGGAAGAWPFALNAPTERRPAEHADWADLFGSRVSTGAGITAAIEAATDLAKPRFALVMMQIAQRWLHAPDTGDRAADEAPRRELRETLELGLRLYRRAAMISSTTLLDASEQLVFEPAARLEALSELMDLRVGQAPTIAAGVGAARERLELPDATMASLIESLEGLKSREASYVDIILPAGEYKPIAGETWIDLSVQGLRLLGGEGVHLELGVRIIDVQDVVLSGLRISNDRGAAVTVMRASASLFDCLLIGADTGMTVQAGQVEIYGSEVRRRTEGRVSNWSVRLSDSASHLLARECLFRAGSVFPGSGSFAYLEGCVLDGMERAVLQGQDRSRAVVRDCLIRGTSSGILNFSDLQLEGVVFDVSSKPLTLTGGGAWLCPQHVIFLEIEDPLSLPQQLATCPLTAR
ncbi:MAG: hypothetical protein ACI8QZ_002532 [Chlamydiales bacterium]|jgi:hypothetical protein